MRLIDADLFLQNVKKELNCDERCFECVHGNLCEIYKMTLKQPTAYDVDKVVEQLEDLKRRYWFTIANTGDKKLDCAYENVGNALDKAIEIVKSGGVADD